MTVSRRVFVKAGGIGLINLGLDPLRLGRAVYGGTRRDRRSTTTDHPILICLFQRGAVDGLSMVVPHGDPIYYRERPRIAIARSDVIDLDGHFGLHPRLAPLKPLWDAGTLAVVHAVGSPDPTRSHVDAQDYMETGTPGVKATTDGWANRYCASTHQHDATPFRSVAFGPRLPRVLAGSAPSLAIDDLQGCGLQARQPAARDKLAAAFDAIYAGAATGLIAPSPADGLSAIEMLEHADPTRYAPANGAEYPQGRLGRALLQIAQLIKSGVGLEIAFADAGGWDTHVNQGASQGPLAGRLDELGRALAAFSRDLGDRIRDVVVLTMSEFGRTVGENGNAGTDHGHATAMLVLGGPVNGGRMLGRWPGLDPASRADGRGLAVTTDFRDFFGEVLVRHMGAQNLRPVFPGHEVLPSSFPRVIRR